MANEFWVQHSDGKLKKDKKVRAVGFEEYDPPRLAHSFKYVLCDNQNLGKILSHLCQTKYNTVFSYRIATKLQFY